MAHITITTEQVDAKSPINELLMKDRIKNNDDNHESRIVVLEGNSNNWTSQLGTTITDTNLGTFTGNILPDNEDAKTVLQALADAVDTVTYSNTSVNTVNDSDAHEIATATITTTGRPIFIAFKSRFAIDDPVPTPSDYIRWFVKLNGSDLTSPHIKIIAQEDSYTGSTTDGVYDENLTTITFYQNPSVGTDSGTYEDIKLNIPMLFLAAGTHTISIEFQRIGTANQIYSDDTYLTVGQI